MDIDNQAAPAATAVCGVIVGREEGEDQSYACTCEREPHASGPHAHTIYDDVFHYSYDDPSRQVFNFCGTCHEPITAANKGEGVGSALYCRDHLGPCQEEYRELYACKACGFEYPSEMRNFNEVLRYGDIHCNRCGAYARSWDPN